MSNETEAYVWEKQYRALVDTLTEELPPSTVKTLLEKMNKKISEERGYYQ